jgi:hypothetical protein
MPSLLYLALSEFRLLKGFINEVVNWFNVLTM